MNNNNLRKRIIAGGCVGVLVAGVVTTALLHNASDVLAKQNVFHTMKQYQDHGLKVLEITPTSNDIDMGYFFPKDNEPSLSKNVSQGNIHFKNIVTSTAPVYTTNQYDGWANTHYLSYWNALKSSSTGQAMRDAWINNGHTWWNGTVEEYFSQKFTWEDNPGHETAVDFISNRLKTNPPAGVPADVNTVTLANAMLNRATNSNAFSTAVPSGDDEAEAQHALLMRQYGLVKPLGAAIVTDGLSDFPIYVKEGKDLFAGSNKNGEHMLISSHSPSVVQGHYVYNAGGTGSYQLASGYAIGPKTFTAEDKAIDQDGNDLTSTGLPNDTYIYKITKSNVYKEVAGGTTVPAWFEPKTDGSGTYVFEKNENGTYKGYQEYEETKATVAFSTTPGGDYDLGAGYAMGNDTAVYVGTNPFDPDVITNLDTSVYTVGIDIKVDGTSQATIAAGDITSHDQTKYPSNMVTTTGTAAPISFTAGNIYKYTAEADDAGTTLVINFERVDPSDAENPVYVEGSNTTPLIKNITAGAGLVTATTGTTGYTFRNKVTTIDPATAKTVDGFYRLKEAADTNVVTYALKTDAQYTNYKLGSSITTAEGDKIVNSSTASNSIVANSFYDYGEYNVYEKVESTNSIPEFVTFTASNNGDLDFQSLANAGDHYWGYLTEKIWFLKQNRKWATGKWFEEYVLGDQTRYNNITYATKTLDKVTAADAAAYDLIYFSGTAQQYADAGSDLSADVVKAFFEQSALNHKAIMFDHAIYSGAEDNANLTNLDKLCLLLWQEKQKNVASNFNTYFTFNTSTNEVSAINDINGLLGSTAVLDSLKANLLSGYNGNFAVNNVYVYDHGFEYFLSSKCELSRTDAHDIFANGDLASPYVPGAVNSGFSQVVAYIMYNNAKPNNDDNGEMTEGYVTPAIAIQFILSYRGEDLSLTKGNFKVLEIEPTREFRFNSGYDELDFLLESDTVRANRNEFIRNCIGNDIVTNNTQDLIHFQSMTIDEFNTIHLDVIHDYDLVYIGDEHSAYYNNVEGQASVYRGTSTPGVETVGLPSYRIASMTGNVYYNLGDQGLPEEQGAFSGRYGSRDLTEAKLTDLENYLRSGGLIVVDRDIMLSPDRNNTIINPTAYAGNSGIYDRGRVDTSSNMYELLKFARGSRFDSTTGAYTAGQVDEEGNVSGLYANLVSEGDMASGIVTKDSLSVYLNRERISLTVSNSPKEYVYTGSNLAAAYLDRNTKDNKYYVEVEFTINSSAGLATQNDVYLVHYFQDTNADGRFSPTEEKGDFMITHANSTSDIGKTTYEGGMTAYNLKANTAYMLRREIPSDEGGYIDWCIRVEKQDGTDINCSAEGYTAVKPASVKYMNVLQIMPNQNEAGTAQTVNLETLAESDALYQYLHVDPAVTNQYVISVRSISAAQFQLDTAHYMTNFKRGRDDDVVWAEYFSTFQRTADDAAGYTKAQIDADEDTPMNINMIVLGFGDFSASYFSNNYPVDALKSYMDSNRPLLTSNGALSPAKTGTSASFALYDYFGQDRYGLTQVPYNYSVYGENYSHLDAPTFAFSNRGEPLVSTYTQYREQNDKAISYLQGSTRGTVLSINNAHTNYYAMVNRPAQVASMMNNGFIYAGFGLAGGSDPAAGATKTYVDPANEGQVSNYPFTIIDSGLISKTYADAFQIDLDSDTDQDGNSDIKVWYTLGDMADDNGTVLSGANIFSCTPRDGINNYYIYNNANVTYTGYGTRAVAAQTNVEKQLFVNTLIAAYEAGLTNPTVNYYDKPGSDAQIINSVAVPYDGNVTGTNPIDSSIMRNETNTDYMYKFVNPNRADATDNTRANGTKAYFKVLDSNFVRGDKYARVQFYLGVEGEPGTTYTGSNYVTGTIRSIQLNDNSIVNVVPIELDIYDLSAAGEFISPKIGRTVWNATDVVNPYIQVGKMYGIYLPMEYLNERGSADIYIQADTSYLVFDGSSGSPKQRPLGTAYNLLSEIKQDLLKLD